jgi:small subunit ribosomal protein S3
MGQKTNPVGLRIAVNHDWRSKWYAGKKEFGKLLTEDREIRTLLKKRLESASVPQILIERAANRCRITIQTARPGIVIGRKGAEIDKLKEELSRMTGKEIYVDIVEVKQPEIEAQLVAENVALQLERRVSFRRAMKKAVQTAKDFGAEGIKIRCAGRLGGAELARVEQYHWGRVPLHTLRAEIHYGFAEANTVYGKLGIKCWICKGETRSDKAPPEKAPKAPPAPQFQPAPVPAPAAAVAAAPAAEPLAH